MLIIGPTYDNFRLNAESAGSHIHIANCDHYFKYDNERILSKIKKIKPKWFIYVIPTIQQVTFIQ